MPDLADDLDCLMRIARHFDGEIAVTPAGDVVRAQLLSDRIRSASPTGSGPTAPAALADLRAFLADVYRHHAAVPR